MSSALTMLACTVAGAVAGGAVATFRLQQRLRGHADTAAALGEQLADMHSQLRALRHDLRGILSPALLAADRLTGNNDAAIRKVGDIVIRTVERAAARLAETRQKE